MTTELVAATPEQQSLQATPAPQGVSIPNLRDLTPTQLGFLADWQRDRDETAALRLHRIDPATLQRWESTILPLARACLALRNGQRLAGLDTEIVENEAPHLVLDALRESRDPENRGADRATNRRLLLELGKRIGSGAQVQVATQVTVSISAAKGLYNGGSPGTVTIDATVTRTSPPLPQP